MANTLSTWIWAARPRTLSLSVTPVMTGTALAWAARHEVTWPAVIAALIGSTLIQIGTNLHNDAADSERGGDGPDRLGPKRAVAFGVLNAATVKRGAAACFAMAVLPGLYLVLIGGWPILLLGVLSILSGWAYTGGQWPIAYTPLGELFVIGFFGVGAVCGTYWLCAHNIDLVAIEAGLAIGMLAGAVLFVNNYRDVEEDARVGRKTLAIMAGPLLSKWIYAGLILLPFGLLPIMSPLTLGARVWPALVAMPMALVLIYGFIHEKPGRGLNRILIQTVQLQLLFGSLLSIGLLW